MTAEVGPGQSPTTPGPTSDPVASGSLTVTATLTEHYEATYTVATDATAEQRRALMVLAGYHAFQWLVDNELDDGIELSGFERIDHEEREERNAAGAVCCSTPVNETRIVGVEWEVPVGRGTAELSGDDALADVIDAKTDWTWSARWKHWAGWFGSMMAAEDARDRSRGYVPRPLHPVSALHEVATTQLASDGLWSEQVHDAVHPGDDDEPMKGCIEIPVSDEMYEPRAYPPDGGDQR